MKNKQYDEWINASCPEELDELTFYHLWIKYGLQHGYFYIVI